jgi:hypothetical protein
MILDYQGVVEEIAPVADSIFRLDGKVYKTVPIGYKSQEIFGIEFDQEYVFDQGLQCKHCTFNNTDYCGAFNCDPKTRETEDWVIFISLNKEEGDK